VRRGGSTGPATAGNTLDYAQPPRGGPLTDPIPHAADGGRALDVVLLSYRSKPHCGGQGVYVRNLSRELVALGHRVEVLSGPPYPELDPGVVLTTLPSLDLYREPDPFRTPHWREFRSPVDVLEYALMATAAFPEPLTFSLRAWQALRARGTRPDVVHDNQTLGYGLLGLLRAGFPVVATVHHPITVDRRHDLAAATGFRKRLSTRRWYSFLPMQGRVARALPALLTVSTSSYDDVVRDFGVRPSALAVVPVGVETDVFVPPSVPRVPGRIVATASADVPMKGLVPLLEAVAKLRTERDVELVVVGKAREGGGAQQALERLGLEDAVRFVTGISEAAIVELFGSAQVAVVPSLYEGFSLPAIEAMACATPLVATTAGALPEVVGPDGVAALHVPPGDPEALAAAVGRILDDPELAARLGAAGRQRVLDRFTWRAVAEQTVAWYRSCLRKEPTC
jgi:glycosyltransferase involved in cell wall biosynthesis